MLLIYLATLVVCHEPNVVFYHRDGLAKNARGQFVPLEDPRTWFMSIHPIPILLYPDSHEDLCMYLGKLLDLAKVASLTYYDGVRDLQTRLHRRIDLMTELCGQLLTKPSRCAGSNPLTRRLQQITI